jgi:hypothetical protein
MSRLVFGPYDDWVFRDRFLRAPVDDGGWSIFGATRPSRETAAAPWEGDAPDAHPLQAIRARAGA